MRNFLENFCLDRGEVLEMKPCSSLSSGQVKLKVTSVRSWVLGVQVDFERIIRVILRQFPGGMVFNEGIKHSS
jgi:hypothetical protein